MAVVLHSISQMSMAGCRMGIGSWQHMLREALWCCLWPEVIAFQRIGWNSECRMGQHRRLNVPQKNKRPALESPAFCFA